MKIGQMKKVPLGLWREKLSKLQGILCESGIYFFLHHFVSCFWELQKEQQISQTYQAFLRGSETRQEILHANISKTKFSFVISETNDCLATLLHSNISERTYSKIIEWYFHISIKILEVFSLWIFQEKTTNAVLSDLRIFDVVK